MIVTYPSMQSMVDLVYPVGSIYMSVNSTNPGVLFGGTWAAIEGRFLIGADSTYAAGETGGSNKHKHTTGAHKLTAAESGLRAHSHKVTSFKYISNGGNSINVGTGNWKQYEYTTENCAEASATNSHSHGDTGETTTLPPYLSVYIWKRTA